MQTSTSRFLPQVFDHRACGLAESPIWCPQRHTLYWVDIPEQTIMARGPNGEQQWPQSEIPSALALTDTDNLLLATESGLYAFCPRTGARTLIQTLEAGDASRRSNDGRADPWGGFWISTMDKQAAAGAARIYRWFEGGFRLLIEGLSIPNGLCFDRVRGCAYYADSARQCLYRWALDAVTGWPLVDAAAELFVDFSQCSMAPDGAVTDAEGNIWCAMFDGAEVRVYSPQAQLLRVLPTGTPRPTCPVFGGDQLSDLFVTSARYGLEQVPVTAVAHGATLCLANVGSGALEARVPMLDGLQP